MLEKIKSKMSFLPSTSLGQKGWNTNRTKLRYKCNDCKQHLIPKGSDWFVSQEQIDLVDKLLLATLSLRGIGSVLQISLSWLLTYH